VTAARGVSPAVLLGFGLMAATPLLSGDVYLCEMLILANLYAIFAMSWDVLSGYTNEINFGHALFIGTAGYAAGLLNVRLALPPVATIPLAAAISGVAGIAIGYLTLRLGGPYFSMATLVFVSVLYKLSYILYWISGGEEGLIGIKTMTSSTTTDLYITVSLTLLAYLVLHFFVHSKYGTLLKSIRANEDAAKASGINTAYYKIVAFCLSGLLAGVGGALYTHTNMQIGPNMLAGYLSVLVVLLAMIGGMGTIVGPFIAGLLLTLLNEWLRVVEAYRIVTFTGILILLVYFNPRGLANSPILRRGRVGAFFFGSGT